MNDFKPDFGFDVPRRTKTECRHPEFFNKHLHRIAIMKKEFWGQGLPGWTVKGVCTGCGREFRVRGFYPGI